MNKDHPPEKPSLTKEERVFLLLHLAAQALILARVLDLPAKSLVEVLGALARIA